MKKILLSCVTCLLAIGLVTACEDEDEVTGGGGGDSTTQDSGTGGGSDTGTGGGATDVTTLYNYTLELTLTDEDGNDPIPSYATAYIIGDWDNWGEFLPLKGGDKVYSYTFESIDVGWYEFKAVMWYTDETVTWDDCIEIVTVPYEDEETGGMKEGNAYFEVAASQGDDSKCQLKYTVTETLDENHTSGGTGEPVTLTNYTVSFSFVDEAGAPTTLEAGYSLYLQGSWATDEEGYWDDEWIECPYDEVSGYYVATFESIDTGTYTYKGVSCVAGSPSWNGEEVVTGDEGSDATLTVTETNSGQVIESVYIPPVYLSNYTLCFTLTSEEEIPEYVALYISGDFNGWALDALTVNDDDLSADGTALIEDSGEPTEYEAVYTYTIESISVGTHEYKVIACYIDDVANWEDCIELITGEGGGNATFEVVEEESDDGYTHEITYEIPSTVDFESLKPVTLTNVTLSFTFYATDGETPLGAIPEGYGIAAVGDFALTTEGGWDLTISNLLTEVKVEEEPTGAYTYTISSITSGTYQFRFLYEEVGEGKELNWYHPLTSEDLLLKIGKDTSDSTIEYDVVTIYDDYENIIHPIDSSVTTDFYIVLLDASNTSSEAFNNTTVTLATGGNYFSSASPTTSVTFGTTETSGVTYLASPKGNAPAYTFDWFSFYVNSWQYEIKCGDFLEIPKTTEGYCAVYIAYADLNVLLGSTSYNQESVWGGYWTEVEDTSTNPSGVSL